MSLNTNEIASALCEDLRSVSECITGIELLNIYWRKIFFDQKM
jgi:hypothetical protein